MSRGTTAQQRHKKRKFVEKRYAIQRNKRKLARGEKIGRIKWRESK